MQFQAGSTRHCRCTPVLLRANTLFYRGYVQDPGRLANPCCRIALRIVVRYQWVEAPSAVDKADRWDVAALWHKLPVDVDHSDHTVHTQVASSGRHGLTFAKLSYSHSTTVRRHNIDQPLHSSQRCSPLVRRAHK